MIEAATAVPAVNGIYASHFWIGPDWFGFYNYDSHYQHDVGNKAS